MFNAATKVVDRFRELAQRMQRTNLDKLKHAAAGVRKDAIASIDRSQTASEPGSPPHSRKGQLRRAIIFSVDPSKLSALVGPRASVVGTSASAHEFGGQYKGEEYPKRPFMRPALDGRLADFAGSFAGSLSE